MLLFVYILGTVMAAPLATTTPSTLPPSLSEWKAASSEKKCTRILLMRHGKTEWNALEKTNGRTDIPLTGEGIVEAVKAAHAVHEVLPEVACIFHSPLSRAKQTAAELQKVYGAPLVLEERLIEMDFGSLEGSTAHEYQPHVDIQLKALEGLPPKDPKRLDYRKVADQESIRDVLERVLPLLRETAEKYKDQTVLMATHKALMKAVVVELLDIEYNQFDISNCGSLLIEVEESGGSYKFSLVAQKGLSLKSI